MAVCLKACSLSHSYVMEGNSVILDSALLTFGHELCCVMGLEADAIV